MDQETNHTPLTGEPGHANKSIGTGTPLNDDGPAPLQVRPEQHETTLGVGPGTPWDEDEARLAPAAATAAPAALRPEQPAAAENDAEEGDGSEDEFARAFEQGLESSDHEPGEILSGRILRVDADSVVVDVGYKSEGIIPREEFVDALGQFTAKAGDTVEVMVRRRENREGLMVLSKRLVERRLGWERIQAALADNRSVSGQICGACKGGLTVDISGIRAFLPASHLDLGTVGKPEAFLGQTGWFKIIKVNRERNNVVVSRRNHLLDERREKQKATLGQLTPGRIVRGVVKSLSRFGAFVDVGGLDGLLRLEDMSWSRLSHPRQVVQVGDEIDVMVLSVDETAHQVALGLKQKNEDPWLTIATRYPVGSLVEATVVSVADFGAFLRLQEGVDGLLPVSELSWAKRIRHPKDVLNVNDSVRVKVIAQDPAAKKITLSLRQTEPDPFLVFCERHKPGDVLEGEVKSLTNFGAFVEVAEGVTGLVHISDLTWDGHVKQPETLLERGQKVRVKVLELKPDQKKISLGLKQLTQDPWETAARKYPMGTAVTVTVLRQTKVGLFVQIEPGIEALIHSSQLERAGGPGLGNPTLPPVGSQLEAKVIKVNLPEHKIALSVQELVTEREAAEMKKYISTGARHGIPLGELSGLNAEDLMKRFGVKPADQA